MEPPVLVDAAVLDAVQLVLSGHHETARVQLEGLWHSLPQDDGFHRCIIAHSYERVGELEAAKVHARNAWQVARDLTQTPMAKLTGSAILRLCARLGIATD